MATWVRINDDFPDGPRATGLTDKAFRVYITAMCYSGHWRLDGFVPMNVVGGFTDGDVGIIKELILSGLWIDDGINNGIIIYKFLEFNSSSEEVDARKEQLKTAKARHKEKKALELSLKDDVGIIKESEKNLSKPYPHTHTHTPAHTHTPTPEVLKEVENLTIFSSDVISLGAFFADSLEAIGCKKPNVSKRWLEDLDRMIRLDGRTPEQIRKAITWAHQDGFWSANIHSPSSLRKNYEKLRMSAAHLSKVNQVTNSVTKADRKSMAMLDWARELEEEEMSALASVPSTRLEIGQTNRSAEIKKMVANFGA